MRTRLASGWIALVLCAVALPACRKDPCPGTEDCRLYGDCREPARNRACEPTAAGCRAAQVCPQLGTCGFVPTTTRNGETEVGRCLATTAEDCRRSAACREIGACGLANGACAPTEDAMCQASSMCRVHGTYAARKGSCIGSSEDACRASERCKTDGVCTFVAGDADPDACEKREQGKLCLKPLGPQVRVGRTSLSTAPNTRLCHPHCERRPPRPGPGGRDPLNPWPCAGGEMAPEPVYKL